MIVFTARRPAYCRPYTRNAFRVNDEDKAASSKLLISDDEMLISIALCVALETLVARRKANVQK